MLRHNRWLQPPREIRRDGRQADLMLDFTHGDRTRRSGRGLHSRLASDTAWQGVRIRPPRPR